MVGSNQNSKHLKSETLIRLASVSLQIGFCRNIEALLFQTLLFLKTLVCVVPYWLLLASSVTSLLCYTHFSNVFLDPHHYLPLQEDPCSQVSTSGV